MNAKIRSFLSGPLLVLLQACAGAPYRPPATSEQPCIRNFTVTGSILTGQKFGVRTTISNSTTATIIKQIAAQAEIEEFNVEAKNERTGTLHATHQATMAGGGANRAATLDAVVRTSGGTSSISLSFVTKPGQYVASGDVQVAFCSILEAVVVQSVGY